MSVNAPYCTVQISCHAVRSCGSWVFMLGRTTEFLPSFNKLNSILDTMEVRLQERGFQVRYSSKNISCVLCAWCLQQQGSPFTPRGHMFVDIERSRKMCELLFNRDLSHWQFGLNIWDSGCLFLWETKSQVLRKKMYCVLSLSWKLFLKNKLKDSLCKYGLTTLNPTGNCTGGAWLLSTTRFITILVPNIKVGIAWRIIAENSTLSILMILRTSEKCYKNRITMLTKILKYSGLAIFSINANICLFISQLNLSESII